MKNTAPLIKDGNRLTRRFLGNLHPENCIEGKELKAYIAGHELYSYKRDSAGNPQMYKVRQEYFYI